MDFQLLIALITILICLLGLSWFAGSDAPYIPTDMKNIKAILVKSGLKKDKVFYELGSGDGRVVLEAAKLEATSIGIEQSWIRVFYSRYQSSILNLKNAYFYHGNIFDRQYFPADVVYIFLLPPAVKKLEKKLKKELKKGAVVITQTYHFDKWKPYKTIDNFNLYRA